MEEILKISSQTINDVRTIAYNLRPYQLGKIGLTKAIEGVIRQIIQISKFNFEYSLDNIDNTLSEDNEIHLYRIAQECLNNALKHSEAKSVSLNIKQENNKINIIYNDDGKGFDFENQKANPSGLGFSSLMQRVRLLEGTINVESSPGAGTTIFFSFPLKQG
jgi:signal transduction histidine kinase